MKAIQIQHRAEGAALREEMPHRDALELRLEA